MVGVFTVPLRFSLWSVFSPHHFQPVVIIFTVPLYIKHVSLTRRLAGAVKTPTKS
jgi:hypothetical protein